jgi:phosphatidate phosphatase APP1
MTEPMSAWKKILHQLSVQVEEQFDTLKLRLQRRLGSQDPIQIVPYAGYGTAKALHLQGRVLAARQLKPAQENATMWENVLAMYRRFESDEVPDIRVSARFRDLIMEAKTDEEGYFTFDLPVNKKLPTSLIWHEIVLSLPDMIVPGQERVATTGRVLVPPPQSQFGVISDIDDTIVESYATAPLKLARVTFLNNARTRLPFKGVAAFYRALYYGSGGTAQNPIFYVSSSPWNLYDLLVDFMAFNNIPAGPIFLRDLGLDRTQFIQTGHHDHKLHWIERLLNTYPKLAFILIGDSGQRDPEIYAEVIRKHPGRVRAVYIRDVSVDTRRAAIEALITAAKTQQVDMLLVPDTAVAAEHAAEQGLIAHTALPDIRAEKIKDALPDEV